MDGLTSSEVYMNLVSLLSANTFSAFYNHYTKFGRKRTKGKETKGKMNTTLPVLDSATKHVVAAAVNLTSTALNATTPICTLSPHARALSSVLTGFTSTILTGLSSGSHIVFMVAWVCWFGSLRNVLIAFYQAYSVCRFEVPEGGEHFFAFMDWLVRSHDLRVWSSDFFRGAVDGDVSLLGWVGWAFTTLYSPVIQVLWLVENWHHASTGLKLARAIGVGVAALPSGFDTRARYGRALGRLFGRGRCARAAEWLFGALTAASTITLTGVSVVELGLAAKQAGSGKAWLAVVYVFFTAFWMYLSLSFVSPHDEAKDNGGLKKRLAGLGMGIFGGVFVAWPALVIMQTAERQPGLGLGEYLRCEGVAWWQKMVAILP